MDAGARTSLNRNADMSLQQSRIDALLDAIDNYRSLPEPQREALRPLLNETLDRFNALGECSEVLQRYACEVSDGVMPPLL